MEVSQEVFLKLPCLLYFEILILQQLKLIAPYILDVRVSELGLFGPLTNGHVCRYYIAGLLLRKPGGQYNSTWPIIIAVIWFLSSHSFIQR